MLALFAFLRLGKKGNGWGSFSGKGPLLTESASSRCGNGPAVEEVPNARAWPRSFKGVLADWATSLGTAVSLSKGPKNGPSKTDLRRCPRRRPSRTRSQRADASREGPPSTRALLSPFRVAAERGALDPREASVSRAPFLGLRIRMQTSPCIGSNGHGLPRLCKSLKKSPKRGGPKRVEQSRRKEAPFESRPSARGAVTTAPRRRPVTASLGPKAQKSRAR
mmetsp:Transcript_5276/g.18726  ORF Transcript_5276/g.18726 Transcript_5276/m.18726 type:complete len:221 (+) Transcript_5276:1069-1731(+)